jgi:hypothetical protein
MSDEQKKYRITDSEGADLFFASAKKSDEIIEKPDLEKDDKAKRKKRIIILSSVAFFLILLITSGSYFAYNAVKKFRSMEISLNDISTGFFDYERNMKLGLSVEKNFEESIEEADSLAFILDSLIIRYPQVDTLKRMWAYIKTHKNEKLIHYYLKSNLFENIDNIDKSEFEKIKEYNPSLLHIITILENIPELYRYKQLYPVPPELAEVVPPHWMIESLKNRIKTIDDTLSHNEVIIKEHFPILNTWINYISNTIAPEINEWSSFWYNYKKAITNKSSMESTKILQNLKQQFPYANLLNSDDDELSLRKEFTIGISNNQILPPGVTVESEWERITEYLKQNFGYDIKIKTYEHTNQIFYDLKENIIDFAVMDMQNSVLCYYSKVGIPLAVRKWDEKLILNDYMITNKKINSDKLSDVKIGVMADDEFYIYKFYDEHDINPDSMYNSILIVNNPDTLISYYQKNKIQATVVTEEELYYLGKYEKFKNKLYKYEKTGTSMMSVIWARDGINTSHVKAIENILISAPGSEIYKKQEDEKLRTFADWDIYNEAMMQTKYNYLRDIYIKYNPMLEKINLVHIVNSTEISSNELKAKLSEFLEGQGLTVIISEKGNYDISIQDGDKVIEFEAAEINSDSILYKIEIKKKIGLNYELIYKDNFQEHKVDFPPQFEHKFFDMKSYLDMSGKVISFDKNSAKILMPVKPDNHNKYIDLYRRILSGNRDTKSYATLKIDSMENRLIYVTLSKDVLNKIRLNDFAKVKKSK